MVQMVKVLETNRPSVRYMAEVPGRPGHFVRAESLPELRARLRSAVEGRGGSTFAQRSWSNPKPGCSDTALFVTL